MLGEEIKRLREQKGMTVTGLARKIGVSRMTVYHWENGTFIPTEENAWRLEACLNDKAVCSVSRDEDSLLDRLERLERDFRDPHVASGTKNGRIPPEMRKAAALALSSLREMIAAGLEG
jgi:transcriptional regulator with XRE-family HTH domain